MRSLALLILALISSPAAAQNADVMALVRADRWAEAQAAAQGYVDPVVGKLVTYYRLMAPGAASFDEIMQFQKDSPDWPLPQTLLRRRDEAIGAMADAATAAGACDQAPPSLPGAQARCAEAYLGVGRNSDAATWANRAWIAADAGLEPRIITRFISYLTQDAQQRRFDRLAATDITAATAQLARLEPTARATGEARLAFRRDAPNAEALLAGLSAVQRRDPGLVFEHLRYLRRANRDDEAVALWQSAGSDAERAADPSRRSAFWDERNLMARRRLRQGDNQGAFALAAGHAQSGGEQQLDAEFLAGFIALRKLNDAKAAARHFQALAGLSKSAITQGRAHYWLGRAGGGAAEYAEAAKYPNTFYGQLAIIALGQDPAARIRAVPSLPTDPTRALELAGREVARAAAYLIAWGESRRAQAFLFRLDDIAPDPADRALVAKLALGIGSPDIAVALARRAGRDGLIQLDTGWPVAAQIPADVGLPAPLGLAIIRQESSFDGSTISPVGARGLMQLMPATAATVARQIGTPAPLGALTTDAVLNTRLGSVYLKGLLDQFGGVVPFAVAGYNAGPGRIGQWNSENGDPTTDAIDMIDWIELIPFNETRNYVQRVIENEVIYAARGNASLPHPLANFLPHGS
jgi:soluble lytic murein transglycosylase